MSILQTLEKTILEYAKRKVKVGSLSRDQLSQVIKIQYEYLKAFVDSVSAFDKDQLNLLHQKYLTNLNTVQTNKITDVSQYFKSNYNSFTGAASAYEKKMIFGSAVVTATRLIKILKEINENLPTIMSQETMTIFEAKISTVMVFGLIRQIDVFSKMVTIYWEHFCNVAGKRSNNLLGYKYKYVHSNHENYINIINDVCNKDNAYRFMKDIEEVKKKNCDMVLYANSTSFLGFLNPVNLTKNAYSYLNHGILGFSLFTWIISLWDDWQHTNYLKNKEFKAWLENRTALLKMDLMNTDPGSPEYIKLSNIIQAYEAKLVEYDRKLSDYENG